MRRQKRWRVRVKRSIEDWVEIQTDNALQAEALAANLPGVISVFTRSAISGEKPVDHIPPVGVVEDEDDAAP